MQVIPYDPKYKQDFIDMNQAWISEMFKMEAEDLRELENIEEAIALGGQIFFALDENDNAMACCMIAPREDGDWEIMKFAARGMYTGTGAGSACLKACLDYARSQGLKRVILVTNHKCTHAIHLYEKFGFTRMPVDREKFPYDRADRAFEIFL
ncbi:MAG: GNAT family N-acetyltransferase [Eggerthellaceae bacterium]|jgi:N-acetylglutamate synthase-like GNAT family acetyltransferase